MDALFWHVINSEVITPANMAFVMRLVNLREVPTIIAAYRVEAKNHKGQWVKLEVINVRDDYIYSTLGPELDGAFEMDFRTTCFDYLASKEIRPREMIRGWAFFQAPEDVCVEHNDLVKIFVKDVEGVETSKTVRIAEHKDDALHDGPPLSYNEFKQRDLSKLPQKFLSDYFVSS
jgi:hypothetical protein